jgi:RsiW-degrading membrane proteinase PrsW (M82 family)
MIISSDILFYSLTGGIIPALVWLMFWLREDSKRPEPRGRIIETFVAGMVAVILVIPFESWAQTLTHQQAPFVWWAVIEEMMKFLMAYFVALRMKDDDEPIDSLIYMMTVALGFAAIENALFILQPLIHGNVPESFITGNIRFVGATLLHTISSATIGVAMGLSFYRSKFTKQFALFVGLVIAIILHATFNFFIIKQSYSDVLATLGFVWIAIVILMLLFEKIKKIYPVNPIQ